jgi:MATE family, multidrug efflux pump
VQQRSAWQEAWRLSWPATLSLLLQAGYRVNDQFWIGDLGGDAQAAMGVSTFLLIFNFALIVIFQSGVLARIAFHSGAQTLPEREALYRITLRRSMAWFMLIAAVGYFLSPYATGMLGAEGEVADLAVDYLRPLYIGLPLMALKPLTDGVFLGLGNTVTPMLLALLSVALNFVLNPLLIYGWLGFPALGIEGAAWATIASRGMAGLLGVGLIARKHGLHPHRKSAAAKMLDPAKTTRDFWRVVRIGLPVCLTNTAYAFAFIAVLKTSVAPLGRDVQAGLGVAFNGLEAISYCALMGPAIACSSLVGRRLGARDGPGALSAVRACLAMSLCISGVASLCFWFLPETLASAYTNEASVLREASLYLWVAAWSQTATAADSVLQQALAGAGRTFAMALTTTLGLALRVPLAYLLAHSLDWGSEGIWWAFNLSNWLKLAAIVWVFRRTRFWVIPAQAKLPAPC